MKKLLTILLVFVLLTSCSSQENSIKNTPEPTIVRLPMGYIPNIQFAPFYVALEKGYFAQNGIELVFDYSFETDGIALVGANQVPFSLASGEQVFLAREQKLPIRYVYTWYRDYPVSLLSTDLSIKSMEELKGKQVALPGLYGASYIGLRALLYSAGLEESDLNLNPIGYTQIESVLAGAEQFVVVYSNNEPILLQAQGVEFNQFSVAEHFNMASNGIVTNEHTIATNPELVSGFLSAFRHGIEDTVSNPDEAYEISKKYIENLGLADETIQKEILNASISMWQLEPYGAIDRENWANMLEVLVNMGLVKSAMAPEEAYTDQFSE